MKNQSFITGFLAATCLFLFIGAARQAPTDNVPRYHLEYVPGGLGAFYLYDAVTGKYKYKQAKHSPLEGNIQTLLEE